MEPEKKSIKVSNKFNLSIKVIFWLSVAFFIELVILILIPVFNRSINFLFMAIPGIIFLLLGIALIVLTAKSGLRGLLKKFLLVTGAAPIGAVVSVILHNAFYGVFIYFFGADFWDRIGTGDEPVFFILAIIVCPIAFLTGVVGSIVLFVKGRRTA
jgi:cytochrome b561